jgi:hypothetical protein
MVAQRAIEGGGTGHARNSRRPPADTGSGGQ